MAMDDRDVSSLRERKQRRTRESIVEAAMELFAERGFDGVTVSEIAARAEVGRTTFFRYFTDKQELLFADDEEMLRALTEAMDRAARQVAPIGDDLDKAVGVTRTGMLDLAGLIGSNPEWLPVRERLIQDNPVLTARQLLKERRYLQAGVELLVRHGATLETAALASGIAAACYWTAQAVTADTPALLGEAMTDAFARLDRTAAPRSRG